MLQRKRHFYNAADFTPAGVEEELQQLADQGASDLEKLYTGTFLSADTPPKLLTVVKGRIVEVLDRTKVRV